MPYNKTYQRRLLSKLVCSTYVAEVTQQRSFLVSKSCPCVSLVDTFSKYVWCSSSASFWCLSDCVVVISCRGIWYPHISFFLSLCFVDCVSYVSGILLPSLSGASVYVWYIFLLDVIVQLLVSHELVCVSACSSRNVCPCSASFNLSLF